MCEENKNIVRFYFDQNILDSLLKDRLPWLKRTILENDNYKVIYSLPTLSELERITEASDRIKFLELLKELKAEYYWIDEEEIAQFVNDNPTSIYSNVIESNAQFNIVNKSNELFLHKLLGGQKGISMESIFQENEDTFCKLMEILRNEFKKVQTDVKITQDIMEDIIVDLKKNYTSISANLLNQVKKNALNNLEYDGIKDFQKLLSLGSIRLNNIKPPGAIKQIMEIVKTEADSININIPIDNLFGGKIWNYFPNQEIKTVDRINGLYNLLNYMGYHSEPQLYKKRRFDTFLSDCFHSGYAAYSHILVSCDERFVKKTEAVYEYLNLGTKIILVSERGLYE